MQHKLIVALHKVLAAKLSKKPPKKWWDKMFKLIQKKNPEYSDEQVRKTIGDIWYSKLSKGKKTQIRKREGKKLKANYRRKSLAAAVDFVGDAGKWKKFADKYRDVYENIDSFVEPYGEDEVKLTDKWIKELEHTYEAFSNAAYENEDENKKSFHALVDEVIKKVCADLKEVTPEQITYDVSIDDGISVRFHYNDEDFEFDTDIYYTDEHARESMYDSFNSWEWLALLADEDSPFHDYAFVSDYVDTAKSQAIGELISYDDHTSYDMEEALRKFIGETPSGKSGNLNVKTTSGQTVSIMRKDLNNVGNTNGRDIKCRKCGEPYENLYVFEDFTDDEFEEYVILAPQLDDPHGKPTRIAALDGCPACEGEI